MAERKNIVKGQIGNAIESVAPDHIATVANQIFDESRQEYQDDINENVGYVINNPEFIKVYAIKETNQLLWGIQKDGNVYYGAGVPRQIKSYIDFIISKILNGDKSAPEIDSLNKIIAFLDGFSTSETLFEILLELDDKKVDKVDGKSLIDEEYAAGVNYIENPEFVVIWLTANNKIIFAARTNGEIFFGAGIPKQIADYIESKILDLGLEDYSKIADFLYGLYGNITSNKVSIIGDSISTFDAPGYKIDGYNMQYPYGDVTQVTDTWWKKVIDAAGMTLEVNASNAGSCATGDAGFSPRIPVIGNPDWLFVELGTNDSQTDKEIGIIDYDAEIYDITKFAPAYIKGMKDALALNPNMRIVCFSFYMKDEYANVIKEIANHFGAYYIDVRKEAIQVHPNKKQMQEIFEKVSSYNYINRSSHALKYLLSDKVDKEKDKSLLDAKVADMLGTTDSNEFIDLIVDNDKKLLEGTKKDGTKLFAGNVELLKSINIRGTKVDVIKNDEWLAAWVDSKNHISFGLNSDGKTYVGDADFLEQIKANKESIELIKETIKISEIDWEALTSLRVIRNSDDYIFLLLDYANKIIANRTTDGKLHELVGVNTKELSIDDNSISSCFDGEERLNIVTDGEGRIISYRKKDGTLVENVGLTLSKSAMTKFQRDLLSSGLGVHNWTDSKSLHIPEPKCALVNFTNISNIPQVKGVALQGIMEFWDMAGNYFKKEVIMDAQGRSSMGFPKKNIAIDICNNNGWDDEDTFVLQIGDWVPQDSFHIKAYYTDAFRCVNPVTYQLYDEMVRSRGEINDYVWKRALLDLDDITETSVGTLDEDDVKDQWETGAKCFPAGFPCIVYVNGVFYGVYSWQLKKHRDNYMMSKSKAKHIHLDGIINGTSILNANGNADLINWDATDDFSGFEIRNPKNIVNIDGSKYDADSNAQEPTGTDKNYDGDWVNGNSYNKGRVVKHSGNYFVSIKDDNTKEPVTSATVIKDGEEVTYENTAKNPDFKNKTKCGWVNCTITVDVKKHILNLSKVMTILSEAKAIYDASEKTDADKDTFKAVFETYFDVDNLIDYIILSDVVENWDGFGSNWQWLTYNGVKWYISLYDADSVFGGASQQYSIKPPLTTHVTEDATLGLTPYQYEYLYIFYENELNTQYAKLRDAGIIEANHIVELLRSWLARLGNKDVFDKEWEKWPDRFRPDSIHRLYKWVVKSIENMDIVYNYNQ